MSYKLKQELKKCNKCGKQTIHVSNTPKWNWILHIILTLLTGFIWLVPLGIYAIFVYMLHVDEWQCTNCVEVK